jgi:diguanylate cyclase (GGDEF)-like protein
MNFRRFIEQLEAFLALEQRGRWCAVGLVDITSFKWYNDTLGHALGDRIIERVAKLLREQIRGDDLIAQESPDLRGAQELHARFGGDEFCFLIPDLDHYSAAWVIAERFREAVERFDWTTEDTRLAEKPVNVDVGVVCLMLGPVHERRNIARQLAHELLGRADKLMYEAKGDRASHIYPVRVRIENGRLVELATDEYPE